MDDIRTFGEIWTGWEIDPDGKPLGEGASGVVYRARHTVAGRTFYSAVKHVSIPQTEGEIANLRAEGIITTDESARSYYNSLLDTMLKEIDVMYSLRGHTNIVNYEDHRIIPKKNGIGCDLFIRMELLESVDKLYRRGAMREGDVIDLGIDIAHAITLLNNNRLVHQDIKPQNIFINRQGDYKLGDYGTVRRTSMGTTIVTRAGTPLYMAPEMARGDFSNKTVDIYSLGLVMYRLLNRYNIPFMERTEGAPPRELEAANLRRLSWNRPLPPPSGASKPLADVVLRCCAYDPKDRYQTGEALARALEALKTAPADDPKTAHAAPKPAKPKRSRALTAIIAAAAAAVLLAAGVLLLTRGAPTEAPTAADTAAVTDAPTAKPTAKPTVVQTEAPTAEPTAAPTAAPTPVPTAAPTPAPTEAPTMPPTAPPTAEPTPMPTTTPARLSRAGRP